VAAAKESIAATHDDAPASSTPPAPTPPAPTQSKMGDHL